MRNLISWYNRNRKKIAILLISALVIGIIVYKLFQLVNENFENRESDIVQTPNINTSSLNSISLSSEKSAISAQNITTTQKEISVVDQFVSYCNSQKLKEAYSLVSDDCKKELYPNLKDFEQNYYKTFFGGQSKSVKVQNWIGNIFKVDINNNALSTGKYSSSSNLQDYITIIKDSDNNTKLNINSYISKQTFNLTKATENVEIKLIEKSSYVDCEYYTFEVKNNNIHNVIALVDKKYPHTAFITNENGLTYESYLNDHSQEELNVYPNQTKKIRLKFLNKYNSSKKITSLTLSQVVLSFIITQASDTENDVANIRFDF